MPDFETDVVSINTLFSYAQDRRVFRLPQNQRQYSWKTKKQAEVLWDDLLRYSKANPDPTNPNYKYYLGNIIFTEKKNGENQVTIPTTELDGEPWSVFLLVDGQQRLTTLTLLLAAIRDALQITLEFCTPVVEVQNPDEGYEFLGNQWLNQQEMQRIAVSITRINQKALRDTMQDGQNFMEEGITYLALDTQEQNNQRYKWRMAQRPEREGQDEPEAGNNLLNNNHKMFEEKIRDYLEQESTPVDEEDEVDINTATAKLRGMATLLINHVQFTTTEVLNIGMAYRIFGTINDRGLPLSNTDLLRNFFLSEINRRLQNNPDQEAEFMEEIENLWNVIWIMDPSLQDSFLMNHWSIWRPDEEEVDEEEEVDQEEEVDEEDEGLDAEILEQIEGIRDWVGKSGLNKKIQAHLLPLEDVDNLMEWIRNLSTSAGVYSQLSTIPNPRNNSVDSYLADFGSKVHYPFFLALEYHRTLGPNPGEEEEGEENQRILTNDQITDLKDKAGKFFMWVRHIFACNTTPVKCLYSKWGTAVINGDDYDSLIEMMVTDIPIFIASRPNISNEIEDVVDELTKRRYKSKNNQVKRFMFEYNESIPAEQELQALLISNLWLEHILPQSVVRAPFHTQNKQWWIENFTIPQGEEEGVDEGEEEIVILNPPEGLKDYIWSIGNCTLLSSTANKGVGNRRFESEEGSQNPAPLPHDQHPNQLIYLSKYHAIRHSQLHLNGNHFRDSIRQDPENQNWGEDLETTIWTHQEVEFRSKQIAAVLANRWKFW